MNRTERGDKPAAKEGIFLLVQSTDLLTLTCETLQFQ